MTVSGQSSGGASAHMHLFSPLSQGLFRSVISLSGSAMNFWANRVSEGHLNYAQLQAEQVGCPTMPSEVLIECLRLVDAETLTLVQPLLHDFFGGLKGIFYSPSYIYYNSTHVQKLWLWLSLYCVIFTAVRKVFFTVFFTCITTLHLYRSC